MDLVRLPARMHAMIVIASIIVPVYAPGAAQAQSASAALSGTIVDESNAVLSDVAVTVLGKDSGFERQATTNGEGLFTFQSLQPGRYAVRAHRQGFTPVEVPDLVLNVNDQVAVRLRLKIQPVGENITVTAEPPSINTAPAISTVIDRQFVENLPLNGRSFQSLLALTPGVVFTGATSAGRGEFSVNGQRTNANYFTVDGVGANLEAGNAYWPAQEAAGVTPALNAVGGTQSLVSVDALEEFSIQTSTYSAQFGRQPGGQISLVTRAGTNQLHGSLFEYFRDDAMDATDWFVKANRLPEAPLHQNQFGGTLGSPVRLPGYDGRNRTFFFFSYEGLRLTQPGTLSNDVPSLSLREEAWPALKPLLATLPIPTGPEDPATRRAPFVAAYSATSSLDATSLRVDQQVSTGIRLFGRFNYSPSRGTTRTLNNVGGDRPELRTTTAGSTHVFGSTMTHDLRVNETSHKRWSDSVQDSFGGATPLAYEAVVPPGISPSAPSRLQIHLFGVASPYFLSGQHQHQRQLNVVDTWTWSKGTHLVKFGADYRGLRPTSQPWEYFYILRFGNAQSLLTGVPTSGTIEALERVDMRFQNFSAFVDDTWRLSPRLTLDLGVRWDLNPAIRLADGSTFATLIGIDRPETMRLAPDGTPPYPTDYAAFGPRVGAAFVTSQRAGWEQTLRGGFGLVTDLGAGMSAQSALYYPYERRKTVPPGMPYPFDAATWLPPPRTSPEPPYNSQAFVMFPDHKTPRTYQWNVTIDQALGRSQSITASYVGAAGRGLLRRELWTLQSPAADFTGTTSIHVNRSNASSDYAALQLQYRRRLSGGLQALASYTLSKAEDTVSTDVITQPRADWLDPEINRGPATFDRRHVLSTAVTYAIPAPFAGAIKAIFQDWSIAATLQAQSAFPVDVTVSQDLGFGPIAVRPDLVPGVPVYLPDPTAPGGRRINRAAFSVPLEPRIGNLPRNGIRGFPFRQIDFSLARSVSLVAGLRIHVRADLFNALNTANFANPLSTSLGAVSSGVFTPSGSTFGVASRTLDNELGGLNGVNRLYAAGGPRSVQLSARITF